MKRRLELGLLSSSALVQFFTSALYNQNLTNVKKN